MVGCPVSPISCAACSSQGRKGSTCRTCPWLEASHICRGGGGGAGDLSRWDAVPRAPRSVAAAETSRGGKGGSGALRCEGGRPCKGREHAVQTLSFPPALRRATQTERWPARASAHPPTHPPPTHTPTHLHPIVNNHRQRHVACRAAVRAGQAATPQPQHRRQRLGFAARVHAAAPLVGGNHPPVWVQHPPGLQCVAAAGAEQWGKESASRCEQHTAGLWCCGHTGGKQGGGQRVWAGAAADGEPRVQRRPGWRRMARHMAGKRGDDQGAWLGGATADGGQPGSPRSEHARSPVLPCAPPPLALTRAPQRCTRTPRSGAWGRGACRGGGREGTQACHGGPAVHKQRCGRKRPAAPAP